MSEETLGDIAALSVNSDADRDPVRDVQGKIDAIWRDLAGSPDVVARLGVVEPDQSPVSVDTRDARFGVIETIVISVVGGLSRDAVTWLWKEKIWPLLQRQMGEDLTEV